MEKMNYAAVIGCLILFLAPVLYGQSWAMGPREAGVFLFGAAASAVILFVGMIQELAESGLSAA